MLEAMWKSVNNHIQDVHDGHSELYPECAHGPLDEDERDKEWLQPCKKHIVSSSVQTNSVATLNKEFVQFSLVFSIQGV